MERKSLGERFWSKVDQRGPDECWPWTGMREGSGYGVLGRIPASTSGPYVPDIRAHRLSYELHAGEPVPDGLCVLHRCDNRPCVNPHHLFLGDRTANNRDRSAKGRDADRDGARNPRAKLTPEQVREVRRRYANGERQVALAAEFGVVQPHISRIVRGINYQL